LPDPSLRKATYKPRIFPFYSINNSDIISTRTTASQSHSFAPARQMRLLQSFAIMTLVLGVMVASAPTPKPATKQVRNIDDCDPKIPEGCYPYPDDYPDDDNPDPDAGDDNQDGSGGDNS
jgi:hypothetical protein